MITRKRILENYLNFLFDKKMKEYGGGVVQEAMLGDNLKAKVVRTMTEHVLNG